jgi:outer membrane protein TolC
VVAQRRGVVVQERARDTARAHLEFARQRFQGGVGNKLDLVRTEQEAETDEALVEASQSALARAREALGVLCGGESPLDAREEEPVIPVATPAENVDGRGDVKAARARQALARSARGDAWLDWLPTLFGSAQVFYQNPPSLVTPETGWQAQLILAVPLYEGGLRTGQVRERDALAAEADVQLEAALRQARSEVRVAVESLRHADAGLAAAKRAADRAREALDLATRAWQAGSTTNLEVVDAERRARDAETAAIIAEDGVRQGRLDLLAALGRFP